MSSLTSSQADSANVGRRERKRRQTLDHLADTAFRLFETHGYDAVTMEQIATEADVAKGTLYNHFTAKEALLAHLFHRELADGMTQLQAAIMAQPDFAKRLGLVLDASAQWCEAHRNYLPQYLQYRLLNASYSGASTESAPPRSGLDRIFAALIQAGQAEGSLRTDMPPEQLGHVVQFVYLGTVMRWLDAPATDLRADYADMLDLLLHGMAKPPEGAAR